VSNRIVIPKYHNGPSKLYLNALCKLRKRDKEHKGPEFKSAYSRYNLLATRLGIYVDSQVNSALNEYQIYHLGNVRQRICVVEIPSCH
jgi:hypothetical protein